MGILEQNKGGDAKLPGPTGELAGHFEAFGGGPEGGNFLELGLEGDAARLAGGHLRRRDE